MIPIEDLRVSYEKIANDQKLGEDIWLGLSILNLRKQPLQLGYRGAIRIILAKFRANPFSSFGYFQEGKKDLELAIALAPNEAELRHLRLSIQFKAPALLGYQSDLKADKAFLRSTYSRITDKQLAQLICDFWSKELGESLHAD